MVIAGLDLSLNSTGITIYNTESGSLKYYIIVGKGSKKMLNYVHPQLKILPYNKIPAVKDTMENEQIKTSNIYTIVQMIKAILITEGVGAVGVEGISYGSVGSAALADLSGLNFAVRYICKEQGIEIFIIPPTTNKKFACGNGHAEKDVMVESWMRCDGEMCDVPDYIKIDDVADSYFLAMFVQNCC